MTWEGMNRRQFPRAKFPCLIKISHEKEKEKTLLTHTENLSLGGFCVIIKWHLDIFSPVKIEIDLMDGSDTITCRCKVVWTIRRKATEELKPSFYDTGLEFVNLSEEDKARITATVSTLVKSGYEAHYK